MSHEAIEQALSRGDPALARAELDVLLQANAAAGDATAALTLRVLAASRFAPDALAAATDRLLTLVETQEAQIAALLKLIEAEL